MIIIKIGQNKNNKHECIYNKKINVKINTFFANLQKIFEDLMKKKIILILKINAKRSLKLIIIASNISLLYFIITK